MVIIVVPAYNEAKNIGRVLSGLLKHGWREIIVVDDGSADDTAIIAERQGARVLRHSVNRGQGAALQTGHELALRLGAEVVVDFDGDDQFDPADIARALEKIKTSSASVLFGSRFMEVLAQIPKSKLLLLKSGRWANYLFTGILLSDAHNGFRVLKRKALEKINIRQDGMAHNTEIVRQIKKNNFKFVEMGVAVKYHRYGQGIVGGFKILCDLIFDWGE